MAVGVALAAGLVGCSNGTQDNKILAPFHTHRKAAPAATPGAPGDAELVSAVSPAGEAGPLNLKFRLESKPKVGQPVKLELALVPTGGEALSHLHATVTGGDQFTVSGEHTIEATDLDANSVLRGEITVVPLQAGVLSLTVSIDVIREGGALTRTYAIPIIALDNGA